MECFHVLQTTMAPPERLNDPFDYEPHPLARQAAEAVKTHIGTLPTWADEVAAGKMFGVLVCSDADGRLGFLAAYSGQIGGRADWPWFVPAVFDYLQPTGYFRQEEARISAINRQVEEMKDEKLKMKNERGGLLDSLKQERRQRSIALQTWLFDQFRMLNAAGEERTLTEIFSSTPQRVPPSGAGECCAPKLLQYAFRHGLKPLCIAEFWQGSSPKAEVRHHDHFYTACRGRCKPILEWMLGAEEMKDERLKMKNEGGEESEGADGDGIRILYEEPREFLVIVKPAGLLSVPGKVRLPSVASILHERYPRVEGPMIVHRLDMDTSGLMVVALNGDVYRKLQRQFLERTVYKRYMALLDGPFPDYLPKVGTINLPLRPDHLDRPRQLVDFVYGKPARSDYEVVVDCKSTTTEVIEERGVVDCKSTTARVTLTPHTGRTHQLRMHCAHADGLGLPIKGDQLYGTAGERLFLHADRLAFDHPITGERLTFESPAPF